jgi:hypothetical protein
MEPAPRIDHPREPGGNSGKHSPPWSYTQGYSSVMLCSEIKDAHSDALLLTSSQSTKHDLHKSELSIICIP